MLSTVLLSKSLYPTGERFALAGYFSDTQEFRDALERRQLDSKSVFDPVISFEKVRFAAQANGLRWR